MTQALLFRAGGELYAVPARVILEVTPAVNLRRIEHAPDWVAGIAIWRGRGLPVVDLVARLTGQRCADRLNSRIIVAEAAMSGRVLVVGMLAERVVSVEAIDEERGYDGIALPEAPYLGALVNVDGEIAQLVSPHSIIPPETASLLYATAT